jgi:hypothetical protein
MAVPMDDPYLTLAAEAERLLALRDDPRAWIEQHLHIRTKSRRLLPLHLNPIQAQYYQRRTRRDIILKPRQVGATTLNCALSFADTLLHPNTTSLIVSLDADSAARIFAIVRTFWRHLPEEELRAVGTPRYANRGEYFWPELNSQIYVATAGTPTAGRGQTVNNLLCSEFAHWPNPEEALSALTEAVPQEGRIVIESTPNGLGNAFHTMWEEAQSGESNYRPHLHLWWQDPQNRSEGEPLGPLTEEEQRLVESQGLDEAQLRWRRAKQRDLRERFAQEYPEDALSCFLHSGRPYFDLEMAKRLADQWVEQPASQEEGGRLKIWRPPHPEHSYVIGADVAEGKQGSAPGEDERGGPDFSCAVVRDWETGEQVAEWHGRVPEAQFAERLWRLQRRYPGEIICERNNSGAAVIIALNAFPNTKLWRDPQDGREGWRTTAQSRPVLLSGLAQMIQAAGLAMRSEGFWREVRSFQVNDQGRPEAARGDHDDRIFAAALSEYLRQSKPPRRPDGRLFPPQQRVLRASFDTGEGPDRPRRFVHNREDRSRDGEDR